jgi:hypothetical protein
MPHLRRGMPGSKVFLRLLIISGSLDPDHVRNFGERNFQDEIVEDLDKVADLLSAWLETGETPEPPC